MLKLDLTTFKGWSWNSTNPTRQHRQLRLQKHISDLLFLKRTNDVFEEEVDAIMFR